jgi:glyoxylase-like metal-dependent hydrolase (beta-lactamase superfamily II)
MDVGDIRIDAVLDGTITVPANDVLQRPGFEDAWTAHLDLLTPDGMLDMPVGGFLVRSRDRVVLVDAGVGRFDRDGYRTGRLLDSLAALGVQPDDVTDVLLTHLHFDHVGWVTQKGNVVFDAATYRCHADDWAHFVTAHDAASGALRKLLPVENRLELFTSDSTVAPGIDVRHAPGHTPGSTVVVLSSAAARAMLIGDVVHCPIEFTEPDWDAVYDVDRVLARRTRDALARELEGYNVPVAAAHFPGMQFGRLLGGGARPRWAFDVADRPG